MDDDPTAGFALADAIASHVDSPIVTRWVIVAETIEEDGEPALAYACSPGLPMWAASGMLRWQADTLTGQPTWAAHDDD